MNQKRADVCIYNGTVLTMDAAATTHTAGAVGITDGVISFVGPQDAAFVQACIADANCTAIDAGGGLIIPGLINTHTHVSMSVFRTLADDMADRLKKYLFPLEARYVTPELVYWGAMHSLQEMIRGGTTTFADMYYFEEHVAEAAETAGIRGVLGETIVNFPAPDAPEPYGGIQYFESFHARFKDSPLITPCIAPHAPYTLDENHLRTTMEIAHAYDTPIMSHLAEMDFEVDHLAKAFGETPIAHYHRLGLLNHRLIAAHCIHANAADIRLLAENDCGIAHNPIANMKAGKGAAPVPSFLEQGLRVGLGTDGPMSGNRMDMFHVTAAAAKVHKMVSRDRTCVPASTAFEMATIGGARALHMEDTIGSLETGKRGDVVVVSLDAPHMFPVYDPYAVLVYCAGPQDVKDVVVDGAVLLQNYTFTTLKTAEIRQGVEKMVKVIHNGLNDLL